MEEEQKQSDELSFDFKKFTKVSKFLPIITILVLLLIPMAISYHYRIQPQIMPALEENAKVLDYLRENDEIENLRTDTVDYGWITEEGELTDHCKSKLREEGFNGYEEEE